MLHLTWNIPHVSSEANVTQPYIDHIYIEMDETSVVRVSNL